MSTTSNEKQADEARAALVSDIHELKAVGVAAVAKVRSKVPWIVGGACGLALLAVLVAVAKPRRRSFEKPQRPLLGPAVRAAALLATNLLAKRYVERAVDRIAPRSEPMAPRVAANAEPAAH
jgi:hypothetical protein